jgi:nucleotide-binding universal stress UspA family protein
MYECILVPLDGSELAEAAVPHAEAIAHAFKSKVVLFQAIKPLDAIIAETLPWGTMNPEADEVPVGVSKAKFDAEKAAAEAYLNPIHEQLSAEGVSVEVQTGEGDGEEAIMAAAVANNAGLIVMSTHGRGGLERLVMGSVADGVLRNSDVPVLLIRNRPTAVRE